MCGIVGYVGGKRAAPLLYAALKKLEYRGYDSAGIAVTDGEFKVKKCLGSVRGLDIGGLAGRCGIGHTRWATHGAPSVKNAHPHLYGKFAVVHNGILENFAALKAECERRGEVFSSETDSEVIAHLLDYYYDGDLLLAMRKTAARLAGAYAVAAIAKDRPGEIVLACNRSPLAVGVGEGSRCASDLAAIAGKGTALYRLADGEFAILTAGGAKFYDERGEAVAKERTVCDAAEIPAKGGYRHFMRKEIAEIPSVLERSRPDPAAIEDFSAFYEVLCHAERLQIVACGTAYHAGLAAKIAFERLARVPVDVFVASEYRYGDVIVPRGTAVIAVSQSGETADTIAACLAAKAKGAYVAAVVNEKNSTLARLADVALFTEAGKEVSVAATKSFNAQLILLYSLAATRAESGGRRGYGDLLAAMPALAEETLKAAETVRSWAAHFAAASSAYFIGRGADHVAAKEGSLKLREISYLPGEGYPAGELKHGTLALVEEGTPVVAVAAGERLAEKTMNSVHEASARGAKIFLVTSLPALAEDGKVTGAVVIPPCGEIYSPLLSVIPLQLLAYHVALARGCDPDRPRNLAKSVTVE